jgi:hypothetical protein
MDRRHFLDKGRARFVAGLIAVVALTGLAVTWHQHQGTTVAGRTVAGIAQPVSADMGPSPNPLFVQCRTERTADIDRMLSDGVITQTQHADFLDRAMQTCAGRFPPEVSPAN